MGPSGRRPGDEGHRRRAGTDRCRRPSRPAPCRRACASRARRRGRRPSRPTWPPIDVIVSPAAMPAVSAGPPGSTPATAAPLSRTTTCRCCPTAEDRIPKRVPKPPKPIPSRVGERRRAVIDLDAEDGALADVHGGAGPARLDLMGDGRGRGRSGWRSRPCAACENVTGCSKPALSMPIRRRWRRPAGRPSRRAGSARRSRSGRSASRGSSRRRRSR